ncbi:MAG: site-2 protease family protein [Phycisphaerales bacterium]|nr:MAG: site-2 protease family protein [Phycisphaerales bacterium]
MGGAWWFESAWSADPMLAMSWVAWVIVSITLHELAHGWAAIRRGDTTPIDTGHMSWNPVVHMGLFSLIVFALVGIAWGAMPINPSRIRGRHGDAAVAFAGPLMNLYLAAGCILGRALWEGYAHGLADPFHANISTALFVGAFLNLVLFAFNLLPIMPLDGGRILASYHPPYARLMETQGGVFLMLGLFMLVFFFGFQYIFGAAMTMAAVAVDLVLSVLPGTP